MKKLTIDLVREFVLKNGNGDILLSEDYIKNSNKLCFKCHKCNREYTCIWANFKNGGRCRLCSMELLWNKFRGTKEGVLDCIEKNGLLLLEDFEYKNQNQKINVQDSDGYKYCISYDKLKTLVKKGGGLWKFDKSNPYSIYNISVWLKYNNRPCEIISGDYKNRKERSLLFICEKGHKFTSSFMNISSSKDSGCPICVGKLKTLENSFVNEFPELLKEWSNKNLVSPNFVTKGGRIEILWICPNGHDDYLSNVPARIRGRGCPICASEQIESKIASFIKQYCVDNYGGIKEFRLIKNPRTNYWLKNDVYIPSLFLHIEVNGSQHYLKNNQFHKTDEKFEYQKYRDEIKIREIKRLNHPYLEMDLRKIKTKEESLTILEECIRMIKNSL